MLTLRELPHRLAYFAVALVVSLLPERVKVDGPAAAYRSAAAHVVSGALECLVAVALFVAGMLAYVSGFARGPGWTYLSQQGSTTYGEWFATGALGYLSYLLQPASFLLLYCYGEGLARILDTLYGGGMRGIALVALPWRASVWLYRRVRRARLEIELGPRRRDEVVLPGRSGRGVLEIYSCTEKPWSDVQVIAYGGTHWLLVGKRLVPRGAWHAWRYQLREIEPGEVIRGAIVAYDPARTPEPAASRRPTARARSRRRSRHGSRQKLVATTPFVK